MINKTLIPLTATMLLLLAAPGGATLDVAEPATVLLGPGGIQLPGAHEENSQPECGAAAPAQTYCSTGLHAALAVNSIGVTGTPGGTYTLEVRLFHAGPTTVFQVNYIDGEYAGAAAYGPFPTVGVFYHECFAYELHQAGSNPLPLPEEANGTPGGTGTWSCMVNYEP